MEKSLQKSAQKIVRCGIVILVAVFVVALRWHFALPHFDLAGAGPFVGVISEPVDEGASYAMIDAVVDAEEKMHGRIQVKISGFVSLDYGDRVRVIGMLEPTLSGDPRIAGLIRKAKITLLQKNQEHGFFETLYALRQFFIARLGVSFPEPESSFAAALLIGARSSLPRTVLDDFKRTGLTHIIALSGFNIVILISSIEALLLPFLRRRHTTLLAIFLIVIFVLMTGASASVVRAGIMGSLSLIARLFGRKAPGLRTLAITGYVMALADPFILLYDIGFQLSFAATAGIMVFARRWQKHFEKMPNWLGVRDNVVTSLAAQVFTLPLIVWHFQGFSIISPAANLLVLPCIPLLMLGSFIALFTRKFAAAPTYLLFKLVLWIVHAFAGVPGGFIQIN